MFNNRPWIYVDDGSEQHQPLTMPFKFYGKTEREMMQQRRDRLRPVEHYWMVQPKLNNLMLNV
jgi:hypothetical protein